MLTETFQAQVVTQVDWDNLITEKPQVQDVVETRIQEQLAQRKLEHKQDKEPE